MTEHSEQSESEECGPKLIEDGMDREPIPRLDNKFLNYIRPAAEISPNPSKSSTHTPESILSADCFRATQVNQLTYPWEEPHDWNPFYNPADRFGLSSFLSHEGLTGADPVVVKPPAQITLANASKHVFAGVIARAKGVPWPEQQTAKRSKCFLRWRFLVEENLGESKLGRDMQSLMLDLRPDSEIMQLISDSLHDKSTATLEKRGCSLISYAKWHRTTFGTAFLPVQEDRCYEYVKHLRAAKYKPTKAAAFIASLNFGGGLWVFSGALSSADSARVKGCANEQYLTKRPLKQKRKLTVDEVRVLENLIDHAHDKRDRVASGFFISQLHSRARFSSLQFSSSVTLDLCEDQGGYIEFSCLFNKTSVTKEAKSTFMPHVAPAVGILSTRWAASWMRTLMEENLLQAESEFSDNVFTFVKGCILPEVQKDGSWSDSPLSNSDATRWLNSLLLMGGASLQIDSPATHSLKSTPLSWAAKFGIGISDRELFGHHSLGRHMSALTYSRDAQARPLRLYQEVLRSIAAGTFDPDSTRSGRFITKRLKTASPAFKDKVSRSESWTVSRTSEDSFVMIDPLGVDDIWKSFSKDR